MRFVSVVTVILLLTGCGSSPSPILPPLELTKLNNQINISRQWKFKAGEGVSEFYLKLKPVFKNNTGYIIDYKGHLQAFKVTNGKLLWEKNLNMPASAGLTLSSGKLILGTSKGEVVALDVKNANELWRAQLSSEILSRPAIAKGILVVKTIDGRVYGLNVRNGKQKGGYDGSVPRLQLGETGRLEYRPDRERSDLGERRGFFPRQHPE